MSRMFNVFEFLGLKKDHRKGNKVVQLVKHLREVPVGKIKFPLLAQVKKDGVFAMLVVVNGSAAIFGRTGKYLMNTSHLAHQHMKQQQLAEGVYIAELCSDRCSLEQLSGVVNPNRTKVLDEEGEMIKESLYMAWHDHLTLPEFIEGESTRDYAARHRVVEYTFGSGRVLPCQYVHSIEEAEDYADRAIRRGNEGAVFKNAFVGYEAGHKGFHAMKIVRGVDFDLLCIAVEEGTGKYANKVANLLFNFRNQKTGKLEVIKAMLGKGWTHEDAASMFCEVQGIPTGGISPIGKIFQVKGLQISSKGVIRLPKVGEHRHDKDFPDPEGR